MAVDQPDWTQATNITAGSVTIVGTPNVNIVNTPAVTISGTPTVTITSGTVSIGNVASMNVTQASGLAMYGPNLISATARGPMFSGWIIVGNLNALVYQATGELKVTITALGRGGAQAQVAPGFAVVPGQKLHLTMNFKSLTRDSFASVNVFGYAADGATVTVNFSGSAAASCLTNVWTTVTFDYTVLDGTFFIVPFFFVGETNGQANDQWLIDEAFAGSSGAVTIAGTVKVAGAVSSNPNTLLTVAAASGQAKITPTDQSIFFPGAIVQLSAVAGGSGFLGQVKSVNFDGTVTFSANLTASFVAGDVAQVLPLQLATSRKRAWDWTGFQQAAQGSGFQVIIAGVTGQKLILNHLDYILINTNAAGATGVGVTVRDNASNGTILWASDSGILGTTGDKDRCTEPDLALAGLVGHNLYYQEEANIANTTSSGTCGGYQAIAEPV